MSHKLKFKPGDRVKVIADKYAPMSHGAEIGKTYRIEDAVKESRKGPAPCNFQEYLLQGAGWVCEDEIEIAG